MKKKNRILFSTVFLLSLFSFTSCFVTTMAMSGVATSLSGSDKNGKLVKQKKDEISPMVAITGENDVIVVSDFFPTVLKMYEILQVMNPKHLGLAAMTGSLNVMYGNAFVQTPADNLGISDVEKQFAEYDRAKEHYLRGINLCLFALDGRHKGFKDALMSGEPEKIDAAVSKLDKNDVFASYWFGAGWFAAFSLDIMNPDLNGNLYAPIAVMERGRALNPEFSDGGFYDILGAFYCAAPSDFGGDYEKGVSYIEKAIEISGGKIPGPYVTYADSVCIPAGDEKGFDENIEKALKINPDDNKENRLMTIISQNKAKKLKNEKGNYFLEW